MVNIPGLSCSKKKIILLHCWIIIFLIMSSWPAHSFYEIQGKNGELEIRGMARFFGTAYENPDNGLLFERKSEADIAGIARLEMLGRIKRIFGFEINVYQTCIPQSLMTNQAGPGSIRHIERNGSLEWSLGSERYLHLAADRLNLRFSKGLLDVTLGRQPVNLATTFFFSPNDFFAPFSAQTFYRVYKPGIDALRADLSLGELSQLTFITVLGYERDSSSPTGWSNNPAGERASYIIRASGVFNDFEMAILGGKLQQSHILGGSFQGELFKWLGLRAEGHFADPEYPPVRSYGELSVGIEHRWENSLQVRIEEFYHGRGYDNVSDYRTPGTFSVSESPYLGRHYFAIGMGYEFTPLFKADLLFIANLKDDSALCSLNAVYSVSDEMDIAFDLGIPIGKASVGTKIRSEFGLYPYSINIELRCYF